MVTQSPQHGDIYLCKIGGLTGWFVRLGQLAVGDGWNPRVQHAGIVLNPHTGLGLEAQPGGSELCDYPTAHPDAVFVSPDGLTADQRYRIAEIALLNYRGVPYSFLDYLSIALLPAPGSFLDQARGFRWLGRRIQNRVRSTGHMICSQMVDQVYKDAGVRLFDDGRFSGEVTPGDLAKLFGVK